MRITACLTLALLAAPLAAAPRTFTGMCDASAGAAVSPELVAVACDEDNTLRLYRAATGGAPVSTVDLTRFLETGEECDFEGATPIGSRVYWITSHGRNKKGKPRPARRRLFATDLVTKGGKATLVPVGKPNKDLMATLVGDPKLTKYDLASAEQLAPEAEGGLNIEGLSATPEGQLLIGFRNPLTAGRALLVTLENPEACATKSMAAKIGAVHELDLGRRGIRSIEWVPAQKQYLIAAGPTADSGTFQLFTWKGGADKPAPVTAKLGTLRPEGIIAVGGGFLVVSDDGGIDVGGTECKDLPDASTRSFRGIDWPAR